MILTQKIIPESLNFGIFLEMIDMRINDNGHNISIQILYERL